MSLDTSQYRALLEHETRMIWRSGADAKIDYVNDAWLAYVGGLVEAVVGHPFGHGIHPDDADACRERYMASFAAMRPFEISYRLRRFDGVYRFVHDRGVPYADARGAFVGFVGSCEDIDDRRARDALEGANDFFEMSLDHLCVAGFDGYLKRLSPSWQRTLGWTPEELMSRPSADFVHPDDRERTLAGRSRLFDGSALGPLRNRYRCKDGSYRWFEWRSVAHVDKRLVYVAARDITEQMLAAERLELAEAREQAMQRQLVFADRMASVGTLAAGVAHEINNPLAYVSANVALIQESAQASHDVRAREALSEISELATEALAGVERIRRTVLGLKTFSRSEEERRVVIDIKPVLELSINMTFNEIRHRARLVKDYGTTPLVEVDEARLGQVFINLLINAAQALPEGDIDANEIRIVTSTDAEGRASIEVRDTGPGIPAAVRERIFEPFFTTKPVGVGTGLGLSICHTIVTSLDGAISVESVEGLGTTFRVVLPPAAASRARAASRTPSSRPSVPSAQVLVVDDEPSVGLVLARVLKEHDVTVFTKAKDALEALATGKRFDVIFSDLMMPEMSGMDFFDELERRDPAAAMRVVFISGGAFTPSANAFLDRVPNPRLDKPFDPKSVRAMVQRYIA